MKYLFTKILFVFSLIAISFNSNAQWTTLENENYDSEIVPALPSGYSNFPVSSIGFYSDSTNSSDCSNASGFNNIVIKNLDNPDGDYILYFPSFSTTNKDSVIISWKSRVSSHFLDNGSSINDFEFSTDGTNWTPLSFTDNAANSTWLPVNNGNPIVMPSPALDKATVQLRLNIHIVNDSSGTYRIDDFLVSAWHNDGSAVLSVDDKNSFTLFPNPVSEKINISVPQKGIIQIFSATGAVVMLSKCEAGMNEINCLELPQGLYFIQYENLLSGEISSQRFLRN